MIDTLQWDSLACRRTKASLILLYKINGGLVEVPTTMISQSDRCARGAHKFRQIQSNKYVYKFSFFLRERPFNLKGGGGGGGGVYGFFFFKYGAEKNILILVEEKK